MTAVNLRDLARMTVSSSGTGTVTLGTAVSGFLTFDLAGCSTAAAGEVVRYAISDTTASELAYGTYTSSALTLTRGSSTNGMKSTNSNAPINMSTSAQVLITPQSRDYMWQNDTGNTTATTSLIATITNATAVAASLTTGALVVTGGIATSDGFRAGLRSVVGGVGATTDVFEIYRAVGNPTSIGFFQNTIAQWSIGMGVSNATFRIAAGGIVGVGTDIMQLTAAGLVTIPGTMVVGAGVSAGAGLAEFKYTTDTYQGVTVNNTKTGATSQSLMVFYRNTASVGSISSTDTTTAYNTTSDKELKADERPLMQARDIVMGTEVWDFAWKTNNQRAVGVFAQDAYKVFPDAITPPTVPGQPWQADYSKYVPVLMASNQELYREIDAIKQHLGLAA